MSVTHVQILSVPVSDQDRARDFYVDVLGLDLVRDNPMPAGRLVQVAPAGATTTLTLVTWFDSMPAGSLRGLVLETDDLDADVARLRERGVAFAEDGVQVAPWGRYVTFADPDGNGLVLQETHV
ncbi:VOC family protein [Micromonospora sp. NPDC049203]|uniref:VOC family protein n=1 Tax=Micromonospora sp. NPDC049203 TaxID=3364267 RepID=UPI00371D73DC